MATTAKAGAGKCVRMRVSEAERRLILARRGAEPSERPQIIAGYKEPRTARGLIEIFRAFCEANWANVVGACMSTAEIEVETIDDGYVTVRAGRGPHGFLDTLDDDEREALERYRSVKAAAAKEPEFRAVVALSKCLGKADLDLPRYEDLDVETRIVGRATWEGMKGDDGDGRWAAVGLEDGRVLALRLIPPADRSWHPWGCDDVASDFQRTAFLVLRGTLWETIARLPGVRCLELIAGRNGEGSIDFTIGKTYRVAVDIRDRGTD